MNEFSSAQAWEQLQRPLDVAIIHKWSRFWVEASFFAAEINALTTDGNSERRPSLDCHPFLSDSDDSDHDSEDDDDDATVETVDPEERLMQRLRAVAFLTATMGAGHQITGRAPPPRTSRGLWYDRAIEAYKYSATLWEATNPKSQADRPFTDALNALILLCEARTDPFLLHHRPELSDRS